MKGIIITLFVIIALSACKKDQGVSPIPGGKVEMELNGKAWTGDVSWMNNETAFSFSVTQFRKFGDEWLPDQDFHIKSVKKTLAMQRLFEADPGGNDPDTSTVAYFFTSDNGDANCSSYKVLSSDSLTNWLEITQEKNNYTEISGKFEVTFYRIGGCAASTLPDTLRITKGTFHLY